ncbi:MAG: hypothetical protein M1826_005777 [Phylliscum demangeonii]|nr:MAG: hypothetical protein M1826_005777 [Phylliscum demangeonii]
MDDDFAQTRTPEDLFDDDFTPVVAVLEPARPATLQPAPDDGRPPVWSQTGVRRGFRGDRAGVGGGRSGRGGRGGRGAPHGTRAQTEARDYEPTRDEPAEASAIEGDGKAKKEEGLVAEDPNAHDASESAVVRDGRPPAIQTDDSAPNPALAPVPTTSPTRVEAVRGDRSGTGGVKIKKLTEEELSARLAAIRVKNAALEEAHRRAEADEASFQQREQHASQKRLEERAHRRVMEGERERNRLRKMKALQGREWDAEKDEGDDCWGAGAGVGAGRGTPRSSYRRGVYGGVEMGGEGGRGVARGGAGAEADGDADPDPDPDGSSSDHEPRASFERGGRGRRGRGAGRDQGRARPSSRLDEAPRMPARTTDRIATDPTDRNDVPALPPSTLNVPSTSRDPSTTEVTAEAKPAMTPEEKAEATAEAPSEPPPANAQEEAPIERDDGHEPSSAHGKTNGATEPAAAAEAEASAELSPIGPLDSAGHRPTWAEQVEAGTTPLTW